MALLINIVVFIVILSVLVLIHEFGHFLVAKKLGIKVEEFGYGFPPKLWGKKKGETEYVLNLLPIGGYVKLFGEDDAGGGKISTKGLTTTNNKKDLKRAFFARPVWQRALVVVAGVVMNALLAIVLFYGYFFMVDFKTALPCIEKTPADFAFANVTQQCDVRITKVVSNSPAEKAGMKAPLQILKVSGKDVYESDKVRELIQLNKGKPMEITWKEEKTGKIFTKDIIPLKNPSKDQGALGVGMELQYIAISYDTPTQKILSGIIYPFQIMFFQLKVMGKFVNEAFAGDIAPLTQNVSGPVGIGKVVGEAVGLPDLKLKIIALLNLSGLLSISLAFFNVLPIPALDGGRLFFILLEGVTRRKVSPRIEGYIHQVGFIILMGLIILVTFKDIGSLFK